MLQLLVRKIGVQEQREVRGKLFAISSITLLNVAFFGNNTDIMGHVTGRQRIYLNSHSRFRLVLTLNPTFLDVNSWITGP